MDDRDHGRLPSLRWGDSGPEIDSTPDDDPRFAGLQDQVDELRSLFREMAGRQVRMEDDLDRIATTTIQTQQLLERLQHDFELSAQARSIDEGRTRQVVGNLQDHLNETATDLVQVSSQVGLFNDRIHQLGDELGSLSRATGDMQTMLQHQQAVGDRNTVVAHQVRELVEIARGEVATVHDALTRIDDAIAIVDQESRRRTAELAEDRGQVVARIDSVRAETVRTADRLDGLTDQFQGLALQLDGLKVADQEALKQIHKVNSAYQDKNAQLAERMDAERLDADSRVVTVRRSIDDVDATARSGMARLEELILETRARIEGTFTRLDQLEKTDAKLRREQLVLHERRARLRNEQARQEMDLVEQYRREQGFTD